MQIKKIVLNYSNRLQPFVIPTIFILFTLVFCAISLVNHFNFRSSALDLGMFNHALYNFAHLSNNNFTLSLGTAEVNYFGDHFSPITLLYSPFYYLFGSYTLLIIQIISILFGGYGVYKYALLKFRDSYVPTAILLYFFGLWAIYFSLSFDFHNNVVAAMLVPWLIYYYELNKLKSFILCFFLILIAKENMALWLAFILIGLMLKRKSDNYKIFFKLEIPLLFFALVYFYVVVGHIMPYLRGGEGLSQLNRYSHLGNSIPEIAISAIKNPIHFFSQFFTNHVDNVSAVGVKKEFHLMVLLSGGLVLIHRPHFLVMLIPIYAQKMLSNNLVFWSINGHYSIEFVPIFTLCLIEFLNHKHFYKWRYILITAVVISTYYATYKAIKYDNVLWHDKWKLDFLDKKHYFSDLNLNRVYNALKLIPSQEPISVSTNLAPHLAFREKIYHFPIIKNATYIAVFKYKRGTYPLNREDFDKKLEELMNDENFKTIYDENDLLILKRIK